MARLQRLVRCSFLIATVLLPAACSTPEPRDSTPPPPAVSRAKPAPSAAPRKDVAVRSDEILDLAPAWSVKTTGYVTGRPLVEEGTLYCADWDGNVMAVECKSGRALWKKAIGEPKKDWAWHGFAGTGALEAKTLYLASSEGVAYAIDRSSGDVRWKKAFTTQPNAGNCGAILVHEGKIFIGVCSIEEGLSLQPGFVPTFTGEVVALDTGDGHEVWRRALAEAPHNGCAVWSGFAHDAGTSTLFFTTGNNYSGEASELSDAIIAVDAKTGTIRWSRQVTQGDVWTMAEPVGPDFDFGAGPQLFDASTAGRTRALVGAGQKSGAYFAWDRATGEPVWQTKITEAKTGGGIMAPAVVQGGRIYLGSNNLFDHKDPLSLTLDVVALDSSTGKEIWRTPRPQAPAVSGGAIARGLFFLPCYDGRARAYRTSDGKLVLTTDAHASIGSAIAADDDSIYFGTGVPKEVGGIDGAIGLFAYRVKQPD